MNHFPLFVEIEPMSWIWILPALLGVALSVTLYPLFSRRGGAPLPVGLENNPRVELEDRRDILLRQLKELEWIGELSPRSDNSGTNNLRTDMEEELGVILDRLHTVDAAPSGVVSGKDSGQSRHAVDSAVGVSVLLLIVIMSGGLYYFLGTPFPPVSAIAERASPHGAGGAAPDMNALVTRLAARMQQNPDDLEGHLRLGRAYAYLGKESEALTAYTHVLTRDPNNTNAAAGVASILVESDQADQVKRGLELFKGILERQPDHTEALWIIGAMAFRVGDRDQALTLWKKLLGQVQPDSPMFKEVEQAIRQAEALPPSTPKSNPGNKTQP
ncbi:MAG: tetratricopeptide repeat protein [Magnetococcales bacterium]|nr:tetratricopeptide repeat protein [Magnetococcales bacterium]